MRTLKLLIALSLAPLLCAQQAPKPDGFSYHQHIPLAAVPTTPTVAISPGVGPLAGVTPPAGVTVTMLWLVNTNASTVVTVTASCTTGGAVLVLAAIPGVTAGGNNIPVQLPADGVWCAGGVTWVASAAGVNGTMAAKY